ncbi:hypothetical protein PHPALM_27697, partial [Phytophthora palmivora]
MTKTNNVLATQVVIPSTLPSLNTPVVEDEASTDDAVDNVDEDVAVGTRSSPTYLRSRRRALRALIVADDDDDELMTLVVL